MDTEFNGNIIIEVPNLGEDFDEKFKVDYDVSPLPYLYNPEDERMNVILDQVADFCGYEFTEIPPNPYGEDNPDYDPENPEDPTNPPKEGGDIMPLADDEEGGDNEGEEGPGPEYTVDPDEPDAHPYPEMTDELDKLYQAYKEAKEKNIEEKAKLWPKIWQAIRYLSDITCWTDSNDDTFISQVRHQTASFESENGCCLDCLNCKDGTIGIRIAYLPHPEEQFFLGGVITAVINGKVKKELITYDYLEEHYDEATGTVYIDRYDFPKLLLTWGKCCTKCKLKINIRIDYVAGYDRIPEGLLPLICPLISKLEEAKIGMSNCHQAMTQVAGLLKRKKSGNVEYEWSTEDSNSQKTQTLYTDLYNIASLDEIAVISRCDEVLLEDLEIGDVV